MSINTSEAKSKVYYYTGNWSLFEKLWLLVFSTISLYVYYQMGGTLISLIASLTGMVTVVLAAKGRISTYYFGVINTVLYAYIALQSQFYGEVMLNMLYFFPMQFIGWYMWTNNPSEEDSRTVSADKLSNVKRIGLAFGSAIAIGLYGLFLKFLGGNLPIFDSTSTVLSVIAQLLMVRRLSEQWFAWISVNIVSIYMWSTMLSSSPNSQAMVIMWSAYLVNAIYGYYNWRNMVGD